MAKAAHRCQLYLVSPPRIASPLEFAEQVKAALGAGPVACLQLRLKDASDDEIKAAVEAILPVTHAHRVPLLLNDRPDLAAVTGCDGAHIGQEDMAYSDARRLLGKDRIIGVTCHDSRDLAMTAAEAGADYVAFGAFFPTTAKVAKGRPQPEILRWWSEVMVVPVVAIGGIYPENLAVLVESGADFVAVISACFYHPEGPGAGVRELNQAIDGVYGKLES
ncbi:MAG: thiamine phosphate synthase [Candidatus Pacebacteria bacterium]|nr:thiamine phosphate synthase [Candidatus Paceibacterota bacterium]